MTNSEVPKQELEEMTHKELREEWEEIVEQIRGNIPSDTHPDKLSERRRKLWSKMDSRVDIEPPACHECGHKSWSQQMGDAKICSGCGTSLGSEDIDLIKDIDNYWETVLAGGKANA